MSRHYAVIAYDGPDGAGKRDWFRAAYFADVERIIDSIALARPLQTKGCGFIGSLVVVNADSAEPAQAIVEWDPYLKGGVPDRWQVHPFLAAAGDWLGGKTGQMRRLLATVQKGDMKITVDPGHDWVAGDELYLAPTAM